MSLLLKFLFCFISTMAVLILKQNLKILNEATKIASLSNFIGND